MKRLLMILVLVLLALPIAFASAAELGVQVIGGNEQELQSAQLDDVKINTPIDVPGFGTITITEFQYQDSFLYIDKGWDSRGFSGTFKSGVEAEFATLRVDILNTNLTSIDYINANGAEVTVTYNDSYQLSGWVYQYNYDVDKAVARKGFTKEIEPFYVGHYMFGCTLPNALAEDKKLPLEMLIKIGEVEITYNIRK